MSGDISYWTRENVRCIISDERYTGCLISRKCTTVDVSKKQTVKVPKEEWIVAKNTHEAIVTEETYAQAQKVLKSCRRKKTPAKPNQRFRGLLKCAVCGRTLERVICKEPYFCCSTRKTVPDALCRRVHVDEQDLETALTASYMELSAKRVELQRAADSAEKMDLGRYACVGELTRELLTELIREIRVSGENDLEIVWNFRE